MKNVNYYTASEYVARRASCLHSSYRTSDGRYVVSENDVRAALPYILPEELVGGFDIIPITLEEAKTLIREGGYQIGPPVAQAVTQENSDENTEGGNEEPVAEEGAAESSSSSSEEETETNEEEN